MAGAASEGRRGYSQFASFGGTLRLAPLVFKGAKTIWCKAVVYLTISLLAEFSWAALFAVPGWGLSVTTSPLLDVVEQGGGVI